MVLLNISQLSLEELKRRVSIKNNKLVLSADSNTCCRHFNPWCRYMNPGLYDVTVNVFPHGALDAEVDVYLMAFPYR